MTGSHFLIFQSKNAPPDVEDGYFQKQMSFADSAFARTVDVFDHVDAEAVSGDGGEHLAGTPPPGQVVRGTPGGDGTKQ